MEFDLIVYPDPMTFDEYVDKGEHCKEEVKQADEPLPQEEILKELALDINAFRVTRQKLFILHFAAIHDRCPLV